ncbi:DUF397 domain-containing protein [Kitasatospora sp. NPDC058965]|uniref:DUF397 domain-containing protein n=1 Tax=Kitasatospora sp. NPDC058965 TaxID=3346682 RepID=UPI00368423E2
MKSSYSGASGGQCVECAAQFATRGFVPMRDSKDPNGPVLVFPAASFAAFVAALGDASTGLTA